MMRIADCWSRTFRRLTLVAKASLVSVRTMKRMANGMRIPASRRRSTLTSLPVHPFRPERRLGPCSVPASVLSP
jgi:hypothetical protein